MRIAADSMRIGVDKTWMSADWAGLFLWQEDGQNMGFVMYRAAEWNQSAGSQTADSIKFGIRFCYRFLVAVD